MPRPRASRSTPASPLRALSRVRGPILLAVSGGLDSMALLHMAASRAAVRKRCCVATFDHATGSHATAATRLVRATARAYGLPVVSRRAARRGASEAQWRELRWQFLKDAARRRNATIVTAHTRDDQVETVVMRILRGAGARGLAGLYAASPIVRPLLGVSRRRLERYVRDCKIAWVEDPTNSDTRFLRNRVRRDLLPAIRAQQPSFEREIIALARRAAGVRSATELLASGLAQGNENRLVVDRESLAGLDGHALAHLWPALAARLGAVLNQRGVRRASDFVLTARAGQQAQCTGGVRLECTRDAVVLSRAPAAAPSIARIGSTVEFGAWRLRRVRKSAFAERQKSGALWAAAVDTQENCYVRAWQPGDTVRPRGRPIARKVKRFFQEQAIPLSERRTWPVVLAGGNVLWVPGVCLSDAAVEYDRGRLTYLVCERRDR